MTDEAHETAEYPFPVTIDATETEHVRLLVEAREAERKLDEVTSSADAGPERDVAWGCYVDAGMHLCSEVGAGGGMGGDEDEEYVSMPDLYRGFIVVDKTGERVDAETCIRIAQENGWSPPEG